MPSTSPLGLRAFDAPEHAASPIPFPALLAYRAQKIKRAMDILLVLLLAPVALPLAILIALVVLAESRGPAFFAHARIGRGRRCFTLWKFRSMVPDGADRLARYLALNPEAALEWELTHKLRSDPRITRIGTFLRRTSLDELPQLWNVLLGDMSIVGPRPIVESEIAKYGSAYALYAQVTPGLTGLWQVSGRNDTSYRRRVELEARYVRQWTVMLDLRILFQTIPVVLSGKGAY